MEITPFFNTPIRDKIKIYNTKNKDLLIINLIAVLAD